MQEHRARTGSHHSRANDSWKQQRRRATRARLLEALEPRVLLSSTYTSAAGQNFQLNGTSLTYIDSNSNMSVTTSVASGDILSGGSGTQLFAVEPNGTNVTVSPTQVTVGGVVLNYNTVATVQMTGGGANTLTVEGTAGADSFSVAGSVATVNGFPIIYGSFASLTVNGDGGGDTINVVGDASGVPVTVNTGPGASNSNINVGSGGTLSGFLSKLTVNGASSDTLTVNDTGVAAAQTGALTATALTGLDLGALGEIDYAGVGALNVNLGSHGNTFTISDTAAATTTGVNTGSGIDTLKLVHDSGPTNIDTGSGAANAMPNTVGILATGGATTVTTHAGDPSNIVVGSGAPNPGGVLSGIGSLLSVTGNSGDSLSLYDSGDGTARTATVTSSAVTGLGMGAGVNYSGVGTLGITLGNVADTVNIKSTSAATTVTTGGGASTIIVGSLAPSLGGALSGVNGALTIAGNNSDLLTVDDSGGNGNTGTLSASAVSGLTTSPINYSGIATLTVKLGADGLTVSNTSSSTTTNITAPSASDTINVRAISSPTTVTTGGSSNVVNVGSAAPALSGNVNGIGALLTVNGAAGDSLIVDDSGTTAVSSITVSTASITIRSAVIHYGGQSSLAVHIGSGNDTVNVAGTAVGVTSVIDDAGGTDVYTITGDSGTTTINTGNGGDVVNVQGTGATTHVNTGTGNDVVNVGSAAPAAGGVLDGIAGALSVTGGGHTALKIDDTGAVSAKSAAVSGTSVTVGSASITYATVTGLTVSLGSHGNTVSLTRTSAPTTLNSGEGADTITVTGTSNAATVAAGGGNDTINIKGVGAALTVTAGLGTDTINVGSNGAGPGGTLAGIGASLSISGDNFDTLNVDDTGNASAAIGTLSGTSISGLDIGAGTIGYSGVGAVNLALGAGANAFTIAGTSGSATTAVTSKSGADSIYIRGTSGATTVTDASLVASSDLFVVSSSAPTPGGNVAGIQGALTIAGAAAGTDTLTVDDTGSFSGKTGTLTSTALTGLGMASGITYSAIKTLNLKLGGNAAAGNNFTIASTSASTTTNLNSGVGPDKVNVQAVGGPTNINTGGGINTVNVGSTAPLGGGVVAGITGALQITGNGTKDVLNIDDSGDAAVVSVSPTPTSVTIGAATINYNTFSKVNINLGANGSYSVNTTTNAIVFSVPVATPAAVSVTGTNVKIGANTYSFAGFSNVTINGQIFGGGSDPLTINGTSAAETFNVTTNSVAFGGTTVFYNSFASLTVYGGGGNDNFIVSGTSAPTTLIDGTSVTPGAGNTTFSVNSNNQPLTLVGGSGTDTFNVNGNSGTLTINGQNGANTFNVFAGAGSATINGGTSTNIFNVYGSSAMLTLVGHGASNTFNINGNSATLNATGGNGTDLFVINKTTAPITLQAGNGTTTFHVTGPTQAAVTVAGGSSGSASLIFDGNPISDTITLTGNTISGVGAVLTYSAISSLTVNGNGGNDIFFVKGDSTPTTLNGSTLSDTFNVQSFSSQLTINTGSAPGTVNVGSNQPGANSVLSTIVGTVTVVGNGADKLNIDDTGDANPQTQTLSNAAFIQGPATIAYSHIATLNLTLGSGGNTLAVTGTAAGTTTNINSGTGNDSVYIQGTGGTTNLNTGGGTANTIIVGSTAPTTGGKLDNLLAPLNITGGGSDSLTVDDTGGTTARNGTLNATSLALTGLGTITYAGINTLAVNLGSGGNTITLAATNPATTTSLTSGAGNDTITLVSDSSPTTIDAGGGSNAVYVRSTGAATTVATSGGGSTAVTVGSTAPTPGGILDNIQAALTVGGGVAGSLLLDDTGSNGPKTGQLAPGMITGLGMGMSGINYSGMASLTINLGPGGNTFLIKNTDTVTTLNTGAGSDTVTVQADSSTTNINTAGGNDSVAIQTINGATNVNTGTGTDSVFVGSTAPSAGGILDNIQAALTVTGSGAGTTLTLDDTGSAGAKTGTLNDPTIFGLGMAVAGVTYHAVGILNINLGSGGNNFTIASTNAATTTNLSTGSGNDTVLVQSDAGPTNINTGDGNDSVAVRSTGGVTNVNTGTGTDSVTVGSNAPAAGGILDNIQAPLAITGSGAATTLTLDDTASAGAKTGTLTGTAVTGLGMGASGVTYAAVGTLNVNLGSGGNTFTIASTNAATTSNLNSGSGNDTVYVQSTAGPTNVVTGGGTNTVNVGSNDAVGNAEPVASSILDNIAGALGVTGSGLDALNLDDAGSAGPKVGSLTDTAITGLGMGASGVTYHGIATLKINLGSGGNTFTIAATNGQTNTNLNSGAGSDTVYVQNTAGPTNINTGGGTNTVNVGSSDGPGIPEPVANSTVNGILGALSITGGGADTLNVDDAASATAKIGQLTATAITGLGTAGIGYSGFVAVNIHLGNGGNVFTVVNTIPGSTAITSGAGADTITVQSDSGPTSVNTGGGNDAVNILATSAPITINTGGAGADVITVGSHAPAAGGTLSSIQGALTVVGDGSDTLTADDTGNVAGRTVSLSASLLQVSGVAAIGYSGLAHLNINLGSGNNAVTVTGTSATAGTAFTSGAGNDTFTVIPVAAVPAPGTLTLAGPLSIDAGLGTNTLTVDDSSDPIARSITVTGTTISGWAGPITYANFLNLNVLLGTGGSTVNVNNSTGPLPLNTTINGGTGNNSATVNYTGDFNGNLFLLNFANGSVNVSGNFNGNLNATGALGSVTVGGNFVGNLIVSGSPGSLGAVVINGSIDSGTISANTIGTIFAPALTSNPANNVVFQATQNGVLRQIQAGAPVAGSSAYNPLSSAVKFAIAYDGTSLATAPQAAIRVTNPNAAANPLDLALTSSASNAKFDLSRLDAVGAAGLKALAIEGDLLTTLTQPERTLLGYAAGTTGGVILPSDNIIGVGVRDNAAQEAIWVNSLMGVAFATLGGNPFPNLHEDEGSEILLDQPGTDVPYAKFVTMSNGRFRVPFGMAKVGLIIDTDPDNDFDSAVATFVDQNTSNTPVTAYVTVQMGSPLQFSNVGFVGDGGSITTALPVTNVSSTGPLGDLMLTSGKGVNNVTAPSVFGNVELSGGSITGTFQTTGLRIDPMTGATTSVPADIGQTLLTSGAVTGVTYFHANIASTGRLISRGSLISLLTASGTLAGPIAAQGDIGVGVVKPGGLLTRFGGIVAAGQATTGNILALGNIYGDIKISGTVAGRIGAKGAAIPGVAGQTGILGNVTLGTFASTGAVISGGMIGDATQGTSLTISSFSGILAAEGSIKFSSTSKTNASRTFQNLTPNTTNWNAINNIWASAATFDAGGSLAGLQLLLTEMNKLTISGGVLTGT